VRLADADGLPTQPPPNPAESPGVGEGFAVRILLLNDMQRDVHITDVSADADRSFTLPACTSMRINGERRTAPWSLSYSLSRASSSMLLAERRSPSDAGSTLGLEVKFAKDGSIEIAEVQAPAMLPSTPGC